MDIDFKHDNDDDFANFDVDTPIDEDDYELLGSIRDTQVFEPDILNSPRDRNPEFESIYIKDVLKAEKDAENEADFSTNEVIGNNSFELDGK